MVKVSTRDRLLDAASRVFARKGYREATVAEICSLAGANVAAVNYYFRSKENLYVEAWRFSFVRSVGKYPPDGGVSPSAPAERRLYGRILSVVQRMLDPDSFEFDIMHHELSNPTGLLGRVVKESIEPIRMGLEETVRQLAGEGADDESIRLCVMSIMGQCMFFLVHVRSLARVGVPSLLDGHDPSPEDLARHIWRFSLVGIKGSTGREDGE